MTRLSRWNVQLAVGLIFSAGIIVSCFLPWGIWPGVPGVQPTVSLSGTGTGRGVLILILAVFAGNSVLVSSAIKSRWPLIMTVITSVLSCLLAIGVLLNLQAGLGDIGNGEDPAQASLGAGVVVALFFSVMMLAVALTGLLRTSGSK